MAERRSRRGHLSFPADVSDTRSGARDRLQGGENLPNQTRKFANNVYFPGGSPAPAEWLKPSRGGSSRTAFLRTSSVLGPARLPRGHRSDTSLSRSESWRRFRNPARAEMSVRPLSLTDSRSRPASGTSGRSALLPGTDQGRVGVERGGAGSKTRALTQFQTPGRGRPVCIAADPRAECAPRVISMSRSGGLECVP